MHEDTGSLSTTLEESYPRYRWVLMNPARTVDTHWGDNYFCRSLEKHLCSLGQDTLVAHYDEWDMIPHADVILTLRGTRQYIPTKNNSLNILWIISHPDLVFLDEFNAYNVICVASHSYSEFLEKYLCRPIHALMQCTDTDVFTMEQESRVNERESVVFVGGYYSRGRPAVQWCTDLGITLKVWGRGWNGILPINSIQAEHVHNDILPQIYCRARATLNDTWPDMLRYGFLNNRVLDALACGLPVITEYHPDFAKLFNGSLLFYAGKNTFRHCLQIVQDEYPVAAYAAGRSLSTVQTHYSFRSRARQLLALAHAQISK